MYSRVSRAIQNICTNKSPLLAFLIFITGAGDFDYILIDASISAGLYSKVDILYIIQTILRRIYSLQCNAFTTIEVHEIISCYRSKIS